MRFMVMAMATRESEAGPPPKPEAFVAMQKYNAELVKAGVLLAAEGLVASSKGARVKFSAGGKRFPGCWHPRCECRSLDLIQEEPCCT